jgi:hypothetical protein
MNKMRKAILILSATLSLMLTSAFAQTILKEHKAGHVFYVSLPDYMSRTIGLNSASTIQYKSRVKDVYGFIIEDNKEDLKLADMEFSSIKEFYENFIESFLKEQEKRIVSKPEFKEEGGINIAESDLTYYDKDVESDIFYLVGIVETKSAFYKVLSWSKAENKDKFKADFRKIIYSLRD